MSSRAAVILAEDVLIPPGISSLDRFRQWSSGDEFPERGRIDYLGGTLEDGGRTRGCPRLRRSPLDPEQVSAKGL